MKSNKLFVKITKEPANGESSWFANQVGKVFEVDPNRTKTRYFVVEDGKTTIKTIPKNCCEIVE